MSTQNHQNIVEVVERIIRSHTGNKSAPINENTTAGDVVGWDSLAHISIILEVESHFGIKLKAIEVAGLRNVGSLVSLVQLKLAA